MNEDVRVALAVGNRSAAAPVDCRGGELETVSAAGFYSLAALQPCCKMLESCRSV